MADIDKRAQNRQEYVDDIVERLFSATMDHNARGELGRYTGEGYTGGGMFVNNLPQGLRRFLGEMKTARRKSPSATGSYKLHPSEVGNLNDIEDWKMKRVNQFSESTFTNQQMDAIRNISVDPTDAPDVTLGQLIRAKLLVNATKAQERKLMAVEGYKSPKEIPDTEREEIKERADYLIRSPRFNRVVDVLTKRYTTPDPTTKKLPALSESDFSPYVWGAKELQQMYDSQGLGSVLDRIDGNVIPDREIGKRGLDMDALRREYAIQKIQALNDAVDGKPSQPAQGVKK